MNKDNNNESSKETSEHHLLGEWHATAICGNDITSSCLYVSALSLLYAGPLAPLSLLMVAAVLWLFRGIYTEVVEALPLNGGAYNALLNTTSKARASFAACLTILSYLATAVISASEAVHYIKIIVLRISTYHPTEYHLIFATILLLGFFAFLTIRGIGESANVALGMFILHMFSLSLLLIVGGIYLYTNIGLEQLFTNLVTAPPKADKTPFAAPLFFGFAVAMLGISGFESSSNFVEEQKPGVFPKTLKNMWIAVSFFNPMICLLALSVIPLAEVDPHKNALLAHIGDIMAGGWLSILISIDAAIVLSGAVLTSYVGVTGLVHRMTLDRCLPQLLLKQGQRKTFYRIISLFFLLSSALVVIVLGDVETLAGVYTLSFLGVMALFVIGNVLLKINRSRLPRTKRVNGITLLLAFIAVTLGLIGNIVLDPNYVYVFLIYIVPTVLIVMLMLLRTKILKTGIYFAKRLTYFFRSVNGKLTKKMQDKIDQINSQTFVFFTRGDNVANLNKVMLYIKNNELTRQVKVVLVTNKNESVPDLLNEDIKFLDRAYPEIDVKLEIVEGKFSPELLKGLSERWNIPLNFMFIGSPGDRFPHSISDLGGVRLII